MSLPPKLPLRFFRWFCHPSLLRHIEGDLMELYNERINDIGKRKADLRFIIDVMFLFRPGIIRPVNNYDQSTYSMYKSYVKIGWRNILKNKGYSLINIGGLACSLTVAMFIGLWIYDEISFNRYHENYETIAAVYRRETYNGEKDVNYVQVTGLGTLLRNEYGSHFKNVVLLRQRIEDRVLAVGEKKFSQLGYFMQPEGVEMFSLKIIKGSSNGLKDMNSILLSESLAKKLFGDQDPINQMITMDAKSELLVTGVYKDLPKNSEFEQASWFAPLDLYLDGWANLHVWDNYNMRLYVQLNDKKDVEKVSQIIKDAMLPHIDANSLRTKPELFLLPMSKWRLYSQYENGVSVTSERLKFVWMFSITGVFVLLLACINFMNLSTARSEKRAKEVGIRKSIGSHRGQLVQQFLGESILVAILSMTISFILVALLSPAFNQIADKNITVPWTISWFWLLVFGFTILAGLLAGSYPALYLSAFKPVKVLTGTFKGRGASAPRRILVVAQFTFSIALIVATAIVYRQIQFAKSRPVGYSREGLISVHPRSPEYYGKYEVLRNEFKRTGVVREIAESNYAVTSTLGWNTGFEWRGKPEGMIGPAFNINDVTSTYGKTIGWNFVSGRDFSEDLQTDANGVVINETAARLLGLDNPVGETLTRNRDGGQRSEYKILGVIRDMVKGSPFELSDPCLFFLSSGDQDWLFIRLDPSVSAHEALPKIEKVFNQYVPSAPFDYKFATDEYEAKFRSEERIGVLATIFSTLAIIISCSGLFGLVAYVAEQRTKEIGIRKVLGASSLQIWRLLTNEFVILVFISCAIAIPLSYYFMADWLAQYKYRTTVSWYLLIAAGSGALLLTILTVSVQALKAAFENPVKCLRNE